MTEQNTVIIDQIETVKEDFKESFEQLANIFEESVRNIKEDTNDKCKVLGNTLIKIYSKVSKLNNKSKIIGRSRCKPKQSPG